MPCIDYEYMLSTMFINLESTISTKLIITSWGEAHAVSREYSGII